MPTDAPNFHMDESDPQVIAFYEDDPHSSADDYRLVFERWTARLDAHAAAAEPRRFGVLLVRGAHEHDHDEAHEHTHERDEEGEAALTKLFNDFRRAERERIPLHCTGLATVYSARDVIHWYKDLAVGLAQLQENMERFSQYNFGLPAATFTEIEPARDWLAGLAAGDPPRAPETPAPTAVAAAAPARVGLFYGSTTGNTEHLAQVLAERWQAAGQPPLEPINITYLTSPAQLLAYDRLILGIPTWNVGELQDDWGSLYPQLDTLDFSGKQVAIFGVGDARGYPNNFLDAVGVLGAKLRERGAQLVGYWPIDDYDFDESLALEDGRLMGLGLDDENQPEAHEARLEAWIAQLIHEFAREPATRA